MHMVCTLWGLISASACVGLPRGLVCPCQSAFIPAGGRAGEADQFQVPAWLPAWTRMTPHQPPLARIEGNSITT